MCSSRGLGHRFGGIVGKAKQAKQGKYSGRDMQCRISSAEFILHFAPAALFEGKRPNRWRTRQMRFGPEISDPRGRPGARVP